MPDEPHDRPRDAGPAGSDFLHLEVTEHLGGRIRAEADAIVLELVRAAVRERLEARLGERLRAFGHALGDALADDLEANLAIEARLDARREARATDAERARAALRGRE